MLEHLVDRRGPFTPDVIATALLYRIVLARNPDPGGLESLAAQLGAGQSVSDLAGSMMRSAEFAAARGAGTAAELLCRNALGRPPTDREERAPPSELAARLVADPGVRARHSPLETLFPEGARADDAAAYALWLDEQRMRRTPRGASEQPAVAPVLSLIVALKAMDNGRLDRMLVSLAEQTVAGAEVVLVGRANRVAEAWRLAGPYADRLASHALPWSGVRSSAAWCNQALQHCTGLFVALLDVDDHIEPTTLAELTAVADSDIVLTDEDAVGPDGTVTDPLFGTAWDPDIALARRPTGLVMVRRTLALQAGVWEEDGALDWDLLLRASRHTQPAAIRRIPAVLVHRADRARRTAAAALTGRRIVATHLAHRGDTGCVVEAVAPPLLRVRYPLPAAPPLVSIIIPTRDRAGLLRTCLAGITGRTAYPSIEILIVDNDSREPETATLFDELAADQRVRILREPGPFNWSRLNNRAVRAMHGSVAVLLNNDVDVIEPGWLRELVSQALRPDVGLVGAKLLYPDDTIQHAGIVLGPAGRASHVWRHAGRDDPGYGGELGCRRTVAAVTGACMAVRREVFEEVGGFEDEALQVTWSDTDLCLRIRAAGYRVLWTPHALLYHREQASRVSDDEPAAASRYARERDYVRDSWGEAVDEDPYFSPNLKPREGVPLLNPRPRSWTSMLRPHRRF